MSTSTSHHQNAPIVQDTMSGGRSRSKGLAGRRRRSVDSIPSLIIHPPSTTSTGTTPPRTPRSPKRSTLSDITEEESSPRVGHTSQSPTNPALTELTSLRDAVQAFVLRLQSIPPPDSTEGSRSSDSRRSLAERLRKVRSMSSVEDGDEQDRRRTASDGTFGPGLSLGVPRATRMSDAGDQDHESTTEAATGGRPTTPQLPPANGRSPISPLALSGMPLPQMSRSTTPGHTEPIEPPSIPPTLHVTRPSTSDAEAEQHAFATVVGMMQRGESPAGRSARGSIVRPESAGDNDTVRAGQDQITSPAGGRNQKPRRGMVNPKGLLAKIRSSSSLKITKSPSVSEKEGQDRSRLPPPSKQSSTSTTFLRPAPPPPPSSSYPARFAHTDYPRSNASSPTPSPRPGSSFARASVNLVPSPMRQTRNGLEAQTGEMVEIPRFKRKELNLALVRRRGPGQRIAWLLLWLVWLVNGLVGLFFDVNVMYMLVQCATKTTRDNGGPSRTWTFVTAAYAICWGISFFAVWLGWEVWYEYWRKWRQTRPAIEPIYTSLPASLHLSLASFTHFTFLVHVRTSCLSTPFSTDIIPETAYALVQLLPGLLPLLPRAGIGIVLLTTFSGTTAQTDKDERFFSDDGSLTSYARGVLFAFVAVVGFRAMVFLVSLAVLFITSARSPFGKPRPVPSPSPSATAPTIPKRRRKSSIEPRDPATTRSPQKTWYEAETSFGWDTWKSRMRNRIQDGYELCMVRKGGTGIGMMVDGSYLVVGAPSPSPHMGKGIQLVDRPASADRRGSVEELTDEGHMLSEKRLNEETVDQLLGTANTGSTLLKLTQQRPDNPAPSSSQSHSSPSTHNHTTPVRSGAALPVRSNSTASRPGLYAPSSSTSQSSHDVFYTPGQGNTPMAGTTPTVERTGLNLSHDSATTVAPAATALRALTDPSRATLPARPESDMMGNVELMADGRRVSQDSGTEESITDDSAALLSSSSRRESATTSDESPDSHGNRSRSTTTTSHHGSRPPSRDRGIPASLSRSRAGSLSSAGHTLTRARSSSITLLREGAGAVQGAVRRARSGTTDGNAYSRMEGDSTPSTLPRRRSKLGLGANPVNRDDQDMLQR